MFKTIIMKKSIFSLLVIGLFTSAMQAQVMNGLKAYYPFGSNFNDAIGTNHLSNAPGASAGTFVPDRFGNPDCAFEFNGNNYLQKLSADANLDLTNDFTISFWREFSTSTPLIKYILLESINGHSLYINQDLEHLLSFGYNSNTLSYSINPDTSTLWTHVVMRYRESTVNYELSAQNTVYFLADSFYTNYIWYDGLDSNDLFIGGNPPSNFSSQYKIDDLRFYNRYLTDTEVDSLYNAPSSCLSTRISEQADLKVMRVFPNPTSQNFTIALTQELSNTAYTLTDLQGRVVMQGRLQGLQTTLNVQDVAKGMYVLQVGDQRHSVVVE